MIHQQADTCPTCGAPRPPLRAVRTETETVVHCERCKRELTVGLNGELPACPCERKLR